MSGNYKPHLTEEETNPFIRSWHAAAQGGKLAIGWLLLQMKSGLEWCLRAGARPTTATYRNNPNIWPVIPTLEELERGFESVRPPALDDDLFPVAVEQYRMRLENHLSRLERHSAR